MSQPVYLLVILVLLGSCLQVEGFFMQGSLRTRSSLLMSASAKYLTSKQPIFVAGGSNGVGLEVIKQLTAMGNPVKALVRRPEALKMLNSLSPLVSCTLGDALDENAVQECMTGCIAAVTTLGGKPEEGKQRVDYAGNSNVIEQAGILGVERIVLVTSVGCGSTKDAVSAQVYAILQEALEAKNKAERDLRMYTNLDWTIIRPGGLKSEPATGAAIVTEDIMASGVINRADVAALVIKVSLLSRFVRDEKSFSYFSFS